jgi:hypothetical protein
LTIWQYLGGMMVVSVSVAGLVTLAAMTQPALAPEAKHTLLQYVTGKYLLPGNCRVNFEWEEPQIVGETMTFTVRVNKIKPISLNQDHYMYVFFCFSFTNGTVSRIQFATRTTSSLRWRRATGAWQR